MSTCHAKLEERSLLGRSPPSASARAGRPRASAPWTAASASAAWRRSTTAAAASGRTCGRAGGDLWTGTCGRAGGPTTTATPRTASRRAADASARAGRRRRGTGSEQRYRRDPEPTVRVGLAALYSAPPASSAAESCDLIPSAEAAAPR